jgi:integrase
MGTEKIDITSKASRARASVRRDPYWHKIGNGHFLGFRRGPDTWIARFRDRDGKQHFKSLGRLDSYTDAKETAEAWCKSLGKVSVEHLEVAKHGTVRDALDAYLEHLRRGGRGPGAITAQGKFASAIDEDEIVNRHLAELTREDFEQWRERLRDGEGGQSRLNQTVNRYVTAVTAALNYACALKGFQGNPSAWMMKKLPHEGGNEGATTEEESAVYLTEAQRERLFANCECEEIVLFLRAIYATGGRTNEVATALVRDYNPKTNQLTLRWWKGRPAKLRARQVQLAKGDAALLAKLVKGKAPQDYLLIDDNGKQWARHRWAIHVRTAIAYANASAKTNEELIPEETSAYAFRHTRIAELLQVYEVDPVTVGKQTGTSLAMMERWYWKFIPSKLQDKLDGPKSRR